MSDLATLLANLTPEALSELPEVDPVFGNFSGLYGLGFDSRNPARLVRFPHHAILKRDAGLPGRDIILDASRGGNTITDGVLVAIRDGFVSFNIGGRVWKSYDSSPSNTDRLLAIINLNTFAYIGDVVRLSYSLDYSAVNSTPTTVGFGVDGGDGTTNIVSNIAILTAAGHPAGVINTVVIDIVRVSSNQVMAIRSGYHANTLQGLNVISGPHPYDFSQSKPIYISCATAYNIRLSTLDYIP